MYMYIGLIFHQPVSNTSAAIPFNTLAPDPTHTATVVTIDKSSFPGGSASRMCGIPKCALS